MSDAANTQQHSSTSPTSPSQNPADESQTSANGITSSSTPDQKPSDTSQTETPTDLFNGKSTSEIFSLALSAQQKNSLEEAKNAYIHLLKLTDLTKDQSSIAHHNLSLIYLGQSDFVKAQIENYLSLALNPGNPAARLLNKSNEHFKNSVVQLDRSWIASASLKFIPLEIFFVLALACLFFMGKALASFYRSRALAVQDNLEIPNYPLTFKALLLPFIILIGFLGLRYYDENTVKAIVVKENTEVSSSAGANQALVTTVNPGLEVIVLRQQTADNAQYAQIRSTGQFSGWVKLENLVLINSR